MIESKLQNLLGRTGDLIKYQREIERLKGEKFNVFTILQVESKENRTHSNFIAELLNPGGSHQKEKRFLELFMEMLPVKLEDFDLEKCWVKKEHHDGKIDWEEGSGGRIDILISDGTQEIRIENKVYAGDGNLQLVRYHNSKAKKSTILYLTLDGREASKESRGELVSGEDYHPISYKTHINTWLEGCQKEAFNSPILRETIRQYQILVQKLTGTMAQDEQEKLKGLILDNLEEAEMIAKNYVSAKASVAESFRIDLKEHLKQELQLEYEVTIGNSPVDTISQIWIKPNDPLPNRVYIGIDSFSVDHTNYNPKLGIGSYNPDGKKGKLHIEHAKSFEWNSAWWFDLEVFQDFEQTSIEFTSNDFIKKLNTDDSFRTKLIEFLTEEIKSYLAKQVPKIRESLKS
ncbi:PDDEXK-like family protein [Algoriphagus marinus]|uniref:PDDEXK-like family protein n=1 Tax=Algoriphagus marinus TaxID=1925762 RepID=UPI00094BBE13|nr:PD-(D/E)XK nuclease family protein [Algoriphagus marinus]